MFIAALQNSSQILLKKKNRSSKIFLLLNYFVKWKFRCWLASLVLPLVWFISLALVIHSLDINTILINIISKLASVITSIILRYHLGVGINIIPEAKSHCWLNLCPFSQLCFHMSPQFARLKRWIVTLVAFMWLFSGVSFQTSLQCAWVNRCKLTLVAFVSLYKGGCVHFDGK